MSLRLLFFTTLFCALPPLLYTQQQDSSAIADSLLILQLQKEMQKQSTTTATTEQTTQPQAQTTRSGISTNPDMSVIGDFRGSYNSSLRRKLDAEFHEAEIAFQSNVDPYTRADFFVSLGRNPSGGFEADLEEGYLTSLDLPYSLQLKAGKFRTTFGKINNIHPHALNFVDMPSVYKYYLGEEGLNDEGFSVSYLVPNPFDYYQELTIEALRTPDVTPSFLRSTADRFLYVGHLKNFWDLSDNSTFELGLSEATGPNDSDFTTNITGVDFTYKWKPLQFNTYQSFIWQTELLFSNKNISPASNVNSYGMYSLITDQIDKRMLCTIRYDYSNEPYNKSFIERAYSVTLGWLATEFQKVEVEYKRTNTSTGTGYNEAMLRSIFVIGAHGAHAY